MVLLTADCSPAPNTWPSHTHRNTNIHTEKHAHTHTQTYTHAHTHILASLTFIFYQRLRQKKRLRPLLRSPLIHFLSSRSDIPSSPSSCALPFRRSIRRDRRERKKKCAAAAVVAAPHVERKERKFVPGQIITRLFSFRSHSLLILRRRIRSSNTQIPCDA